MSFSLEKIARDPSLSWSDRARAAKALLATHSAERLEARQTAVDYCSAPAAQDVGWGVGPIWQYWAQGEDAAPDLVRACLRSVRRYAGSRKVVVLNDKSLSLYVTLPDHIFTKRGEIISPTHFSDVLRLELLSKYGGTWMDATVLLTAPIPRFVEHTKFFVFRRNRDPFILSSWFIHAVREHPLVESTKAALLSYWAANDALCDYFLLHHLFEANIALHGSLQKMWNEMPNLSACPPHALQQKLLLPYSESEFHELITSSWIHKLTHKLEAKDSFSGTYLEAIVRQN